MKRLPNIVFILADDLGYGDLSCYGQTRFTTPNIDRIANEGMTFMQSYSGNAVCAPSRSVLMTGLHPGHTPIRDNREAADKKEGQFPLPMGTVILPMLLQKLGYVCGAFGKWGLGGPDTHAAPLKMGISRFFGYNCQREAHNFYPPYLWDDDKKVPLNNPKFPAHQKLPEGADPENPGSYVSFTGKDYAPDTIMAQARQFIQDNKDKPFFCFVPTTVPHLALQIPDDSLTEFAGKFPEKPYPGGRSYLPHRTPRAAYAAMITRLDKEVGRLLALVAELGLDSDTIFVFTSDNGPLYDELGGTDTEFFNSARGLRGRKGSLYEGGIRVPTVVRWKGKIKPGSVSERVIGFEDWLPTLFELLEKRTPVKTDGISFAPTLLGNRQPERPFFYREFPGYGGQQLARIGEWKAVRQSLNKTAKNPSPVVKTELYNLKTDPNETTDVAVQNPQWIARLEKLLKDQHVPSKDFPLGEAEGRAVGAPYSIGSSHRRR
jgi:arylsulfatase A